MVKPGRVAKVFHINEEKLKESVNAVKYFSDKLPNYDIEVSPIKYTDEVWLQMNAPFNEDGYGSLKDLTEVLIRHGSISYPVSFRPAEYRKLRPRVLLSLKEEKTSKEISNELEVREDVVKDCLIDLQIAGWVNAGNFSKNGRLEEPRQLYSLNKYMVMLYKNFVKDKIEALIK